MNKKTLLKIFVSVLLFAIIFSNISIAELVENLRLLDLRYVPFIILLLILNYIISSFRWKQLLIFENSQTITVRFLTKLYFIGAFFNNFMPTSIGGDVYKIFRLGNKLGSKAHAFSATFMERFTGMVVLVLISYFGLIFTLDFWINLLPDVIKQNYNLVLLTEFIAFTGFWIASALGFFALRFVATKSKKVKGLYDSLLLYKKQHKVLIWALLTSFLVQFLAILTQYFIFIAMGVDLPFPYALFVFPVITLASFFIPSLNGVGVQDALYIQLFGLTGVSIALALSTSIAYHLFRLFVSLLGGLAYAFEKDH